ncbi:MAG: bifunctional nicotinamidase/pyrazinamidase [Bacteroidota bacterium]|nr:bifunctional nicotinamidase/pyrazinamidase [Bacteroidota bacterium]
MKTLIIVDPQIDFMPGGSLEVPKGNEIISVINQLIPKFDLIVATQDWHPANHKSFASNNPGTTVFDTTDLNGTQQIMWPDHCIQGTKGSEFHPELNTHPIAAIFRKGMDVEVDSYSGFYDNNKANSTGLSGFLQEKGAKDLYFCGLAADVCVYFTLKDALNEGFNVTLIEDGVRALDEKTFSNQKEKLLKQGAKITIGSKI